MAETPWLPHNEAEPTVQLVLPDGSENTDTQWDHYRNLVKDVDAATWRTWYRDMALMRRFDEEATALQRTGELALFTQARGQEAAQIGSVHATRTQDWIFPAYREHGVLQVRGVPLKEELHLFRGVDHGGWDTEKHHVHLNTLVISAHTLHATGYAMGIQRDGLVATGDPNTDAAVMVYFGDGATSEGDTSEALNFAAVNQAPVVFFCQNNQWAISVPGTRQYRGPLVRRGAGFGVPCVRVDGNDVLAVHAVTREAMERARNGGGPTFIEAVTFRQGAHTTSDDPTRYRGTDEEQYWSQRDPVERVVARLRAMGAWDEPFHTEVTREADEFAAELRTYVRSLGRPASSAMFDHAYATPHAINQTERDWFAGFERDLADSEGGH